MKGAETLMIPYFMFYGYPKKCALLRWMYLDEKCWTTNCSHRAMLLRSGAPTSDSVHFSDDCPSSDSPTRRPGTGGRGTPTGELWLVDGVNTELWLAAAPRWCWSWWSRCSWRWSFRCPPWPRCTPSPPGQDSSMVTRASKKDPHEGS